MTCTLRTSFIDTSPETTSEQEVARTTEPPSNHIASSSNVQAGLSHHNQSRRRQGRIANQLRSSPPQRHLSIPFTRLPESDRASSSLESSYPLFSNGLWNVLWRILDNVILLQMGSAYMIRFHELTLVAEGGSDLKSIDDWRKDQQAEWDRLSLTVRPQCPLTQKAAF